MKYEKPLIIILSILILIVCCKLSSEAKVRYIFANIAYGNHNESTEDIVFSKASGFYNKEFTLRLYAPTDEIYYTLDGSIPDKNAILYTEEILVKNVSDNPNVYRSIQNIIRDWKTYEIPKEAIDKAVIIRAIAIDDYGNTSDIVTKTYFVDMENYQDGYVLSIVSEPEELFGEDGIYVTGKEYDEWYLGDQEGNMPLCNFEKEGRDSEIETTIALFLTS